MPKEIEVPELFVGARNDGLGERLKAIVNAMVLSTAFGAHFKIMWPMRTDMHGSHAIIDEKDFFSETFISDFLIHGEFSEGRSHPFGEIGILATGDGPRAAVMTHQHQLPSEVLSQAQRSENGGSFADHFNRIRFAPAIQQAVDLAREVKFSSEFTAIHLRAGDIIEGRFRFEFNRFLRKAFPFTLASEVISREMESGRQVVIFGQDEKLCKIMADRHGAMVAGDLARSLNLTQYQSAVFEIVLMSRGEKIIAGNSGFSDMAAFLRETKSVDAWSLIPREEIADITRRKIEDPAFGDVPALQRSYARWCAVYDCQKIMPAEWSISQLKRALVDDPDNGLFQLVAAVMIGSHDGLKALEAWMSEAIANDEQSFIRKRRIGGIAHVLRMQPSPTRHLAEPYVDVLLSLSPGAQHPFTSFALGYSLYIKKDRVEDAKRMFRSVLDAGSAAPAWMLDLAQKNLEQQ